MIDLSKVILATGNYENVKSGNTVSITGDGGNAWGYFGPSYKKLAPKLITYIPYAKKYEELLKEKEYLNLYQYSILKTEIENEYIKSYYETRLKDLDVINLLNTLNKKFGNEIILLCHENVNEFCHRRLIADYIELKTNFYIPEVSIDKTGKIKKLIPINYKDRLKKIIQ